MAVVSSPVLLSVAWKPSPIASIATSTPTTPAMPTTITEEAPQRCGRLATPMRVAASASRPPRTDPQHQADHQQQHGQRVAQPLLEFALEHVGVLLSGRPVRRRSSGAWHAAPATSRR
ncbi:hypothetical protein G6F31_020641 [Rhizopus arrhizus]|nr:hypothetical protein G6F31_020641 [Rhizopus arrhizus]